VFSRPLGLATRIKWSVKIVIFYVSAYICRPYVKIKIQKNKKTQKSRNRNPRSHRHPPNRHRPYSKPLSSSSPSTSSLSSSWGRKGLGATRPASPVVGAGDGSAAPVPPHHHYASPLLDPLPPSGGGGWLAAVGTARATTAMPSHH
jgi:hypothetical protein